jgi:hypothetical protein
MAKQQNIANGVPFRAVRTLRDKSNIYVLLPKSIRPTGAGG